LEFKQKIQEYESFLSRNGNKVLSTGSLDELYKKKRELELKEKTLEKNFNELSEIIPFAISAGKLEEVMEHLKEQEHGSALRERQNEIIEKNNQLLEKLFNNPPFPSDGDIPFAKKMFYAEKAKNIIEDVFGKPEDENHLEFEHDITKSDNELIEETFQYIRKQSKDIFEQTIDNFVRVKNEIIEVERLVKKIESDQQDEEVIRYTNNKTDTERKVERLIEEKGALQNQKEQLKKTIESDNQRLQILIKKIEVSEQKSKKLHKANQYIKSLKTFVDSQKQSKCSILEKGIYDEMQKLMHKLQDDNNNFIAAVKAETLPDNDGLKITLLDNKGNIRHKESFSQGEKQIYISSLVKAILSLSIQEFPIFIDTPLGRLDDEHIKNILLNYYPDLASQVVLMATNNEIPPSRYKLVSENVSQTYLLENVNNKTTFKSGYFQSYEN
jgi:DNA sulfur modification protein DndD